MFCVPKYELEFENEFKPLSKMLDVRVLVEELVKSESQEFARGVVYPLSLNSKGSTSSGTSKISASLMEAYG